MKDITFMWPGWWPCLITNTNLKFSLLGSGKKGRNKIMVTGQRLERSFSISNQYQLLQFGIDIP